MGYLYRPKHPPKGQTYARAKAEGGPPGVERLVGQVLHQREARPREYRDQQGDRSQAVPQGARGLSVRELRRLAPGCVF